MKYTTMRTRNVSNDKNKWSNCSICDNKSKWFYMTTDQKRVCPDCRNKDNEAVIVNE